MRTTRMTSWESSVALRELRISNLAVLSGVTLPLERGFTALSGETGAGKSVCIAALRAVLGGRVDADMVRPGADAATVAAVFDEVPSALHARLAELGAPDDELLTLSRHLPRGGRGTCRLNGALVSQNVLREVGDVLVEVTAQGTSHRLQRSGVQRDILDAAGGESATHGRNAMSAAFRECTMAAQELHAARRSAAASESELTRARDTAAELGPLQLRADEEHALAAERLRLRHAVEIAAAADRLAEATGADEHGAADVIAAAAGQAAALGAMDSRLRDLAAAADDLVERIRDMHLDAARIAGSVTVDDQRLAVVEERLDALARVKRRHGSIGEAMAALNGAARLIAAHESGDGELAALETALDAARSEAGRAAAALSRIREGAARELERSVTQQLRRLALPHARFKVSLAVTPDADGVDVDGELLRCSAAGVDSVEFRLATNRDVLPMPLDQGPSGGELSRLALALCAVVTERGGPALVLDEVDSGIGGETAATVGDMLAQIGRARQVIVVTHRAEIAARATGHARVAKRQAPGGPVTTVEQLDGEARLREVARLLSGRATDAALARADELLHEGGAHARGQTPGAVGARR